MDTHSMRYEVVEVGPGLAITWLATMQNNRRLSEHVVAKYAADMLEGRWTLTAQPLQFDSSGSLIDGQHRLKAVVSSGCAVPFLVVWNAPNENLDAGKTRTAADWATMAGVTNAHTTCVAARLVLRYEALQPGERMSSSNWTADRPSVVYERAQEDKALQASVSFCRSKEWAGWHSEGVMAFVHYFAKRTSQEKADEFVLSTRDGVNLQRTDVVYLLRSCLLQRRSPKHARLTNLYKSAITVKAWLAFEAGTPLKMLKWPSDEGFPRFRCDAMTDAKV